MRRITGLLVAAVALAAASVAFAGSPSQGVQSLTGDFAASNSTVYKVADGVRFGTYADGGALGGSLLYYGFNGHKLSDLTDFSYTFTYRQSGVSTGAAPYARVFLDGDVALDSDADGNPANDRDHDVILDPSFCATQTPAEATDLMYQMVNNSVRYDDDGCDGTPPDNQPWADVVAVHGNEVVSALVVSQGFSTGLDVSAILRQITVNGKAYKFNIPPEDGHNGKNGTNGNDGKNGANGVSAASGVILNPIAIISSNKIGNYVKVKVKCPKASGICEGRLRLTKGGRIIRSKSFLIDGGKSKTLSLKVKWAAKKSTFKLVAYSRDQLGVVAKTTKTFTGKFS